MVIARAFFSAVMAGICTAVAAAVGALLTSWLQDDQLAIELIQTGVFRFNGILVGATGYGLLAFVYRSGMRMLAQLTRILVCLRSSRSSTRVISIA